MSLRSTCSLFIIGALILLAGCKDKSESDFAKCMQADTAGDVKSAWDECSAAVAADPDSASGKHAAVKLVEMKDRYDDYGKCVQANPTTGDIEGVWSACNNTVAANPNSVSGKAAAAKLVELKPAYDKWKVDADAKAAVAAAAAKEAAERQARQLRAKVKAKYWGFDPDGDCQAGGKPPYRKNYEGGTYAENETVAVGDGCVHLFEAHSTHSPNDNTFCCPK